MMGTIGNTSATSSVYQQFTIDKLSTNHLSLRREESGNTAASISPGITPIESPSDSDSMTSGSEINLNAQNSVALQESDHNDIATTNSNSKLDREPWEAKKLLPPFSSEVPKWINLFYGKKIDRLKQNLENNRALFIEELNEIYKKNEQLIRETAEFDECPTSVILLPFKAEHLRINNEINEIINNAENSLKQFINSFKQFIVNFPTSIQIHSIFLEFFSSLTSLFSRNSESQNPLNSASIPASANRFSDFMRTLSLPTFRDSST